MKRDKVPTLERPLYLLSFFTSQNSTWKLHDLSRASGIPKASCLRILEALIQFDFVQREENIYQLGPRIIGLARVLNETNVPKQIADPYLRELRDRTGQTVQWIVRSGFEAVCIESFVPQNAVRVYVSPGHRVPLYAGASPRTLLAFAPASLVDKVLSGRRRRFTATTPVDAKRLRSLLRLTRQTWISASDGELAAHTFELAVPVFSGDGSIVASISIVGLSLDFRDPEDLRRLLELLIVSGRDVSRSLGFLNDWEADANQFLESYKGLVAQSLSGGVG